MTRVIVAVTGSSAAVFICRGPSQRIADAVSEKGSSLRREATMTAPSARSTLPPAPRAGGSRAGGRGRDPRQVSDRSERQRGRLSRDAGDPRDVSGREVHLLHAPAVGDPGAAREAALCRRAGVRISGRNTARDRTSARHGRAAFSRNVAGTKPAATRARVARPARPLLARSLQIRGVACQS